MTVKLEIWLMRHAEPEESLTMPDPDRRLTAKGRWQAARQGDALRSAHAAIDAVIASPLRRARETAELVAGAVGGAPVSDDKRLATASAPEEIVAIAWEVALADPKTRGVLLVGHQPAMGQARAHLTGNPAATGMDKAAVHGFRVTFDEAGRPGEIEPLASFPKV